ncbi:hypothetical protein Brsp03_04076 [Brucella sp. NBRC 12951]
MGRHHQHCTDERNELCEDQRAHTAPAVGDPAADWIECDRYPRGERRHKRNLRRIQPQIPCHRPKPCAQRRIGEGIKKQAAECKPPDDTGATSNTVIRINVGNNIRHAPQGYLASVHYGVLPTSLRHLQEDLSGFQT